MTAHDDERTAQLSESLSAVRTRLDAAVDAAGRRRGDVELLVVTKFFPAEDVARLITLGEKDFGESREPEASRKIDELRADAGGDLGDVDLRQYLGCLAPAYLWLGRRLWRLLG